MDATRSTTFKYIAKAGVLLLVAILYVLNASYFNTSGRETRMLQNKPTSNLEITQDESIGENKTNIKTKKYEFLVNTEQCKIKNFSANDDSLKYIIHKANIVKCDHFSSFSYVQTDACTLHILWNKLQGFISPKTLSYCKLWPITRPVSEHSRHNSWAYIEPNTVFTNATKLRHDFVRVRCFDSDDKEVYKNFHSCVQEKKFIEQLRKRKFKERKRKNPRITEHFNVLLLGTDSVSRLNSLRFLRKTRRFLERKLGAVEMLGYNKVADNTFPNVVPILSGKHVEELPWSQRRPIPFDKFPFIWKNFSEQGFRTLFLEDSPYGAIFDYIKPGFVQTPTDYYNRHYHLAMDEEQDLWYYDNNCMRDKLQTDLVLDYMWDFLVKFRTRPHFGFVFLTRTTHDNLENLATLDNIFYRSFKEAYEKALFNNTVLIFFSDHGIRFGPIRKTFLGKVEERLPMMFVILPYWFRRKYLTFYDNLRQNAHALTSPFDVYETLIHLLNFKNNSHRNPHKKFRGYSFLDPIPHNRSCQNAGITEHWCACAEMVAVNTSGTAVGKAAKFLLEEIHMKLYTVWDLCLKYNISKINNVYMLKPSNGVLEKMYTSYQITITVTPGGGEFEGTVRWSARNKGFSLEGDISRINAYGQEKRCNVTQEQEKFCYCKDNLLSNKSTTHLPTES